MSMEPMIAGAGQQQPSVTGRPRAVAGPAKLAPSRRLASISSLGLPLSQNSTLDSTGMPSKETPRA